jgi:hypothetical protein
MQKQRHTVSMSNVEGLSRNGFWIVDQTFIGGLLVPVLYRGSQQPQSLHALPQRKKTFNLLAHSQAAPIVSLELVCWFVLCFITSWQIEVDLEFDG